MTFWNWGKPQNFQPRILSKAHAIPNVDAGWRAQTVEREDDRQKGGGGGGVGGGRERESAGFRIFIGCFALGCRSGWPCLFGQFLWGANTEVLGSLKLTFSVIILLLFSYYLLLLFWLYELMWYRAIMMQRAWLTVDSLTCCSDAPSWGQHGAAGWAPFSSWITYGVFNKAKLPGSLLLWSGVWDWA